MWLLTQVLTEILNQFHNLLTTLGLQNKQAKIVFLGLDNAGKSTLLRRLTSGRLAALQPTFQPHSETVTMGGVAFTTFDLGGHTQARRLWASYAVETQGLVFIVDTADHERFAEAAAELKGMLDLEALHGVPFVVLGNKTDRVGAVNEAELRGALGVYNGYRDRDVGVFMCSVVLGEGYKEAIRWLAARV